MPRVWLPCCTFLLCSRTRLPHRFRCSNLPALACKACRQLYSTIRGLPGRETGSASSACAPDDLAGRVASASLVGDVEDVRRVALDVEQQHQAIRPAGAAHRTSDTQPAWDGLHGCSDASHAATDGRDRRARTETTLNALLLLTHDVTAQSLQARARARRRTRPICSVLHEGQQASGAPCRWTQRQAAGTGV